MTKILIVVKDADMRCRHEGLLAQAISRGATKKQLASGNVVVFLNSKKSQVAILGFKNTEDKFGVLATWKSPHGRVPMDAIQHIPEFYGGEGFRMESAVKKALEKLLAKRKKKTAPEVLH